jgi:hypothetical protein
MGLRDLVYFHSMEPWKPFKFQTLISIFCQNQYTNSERIILMYAGYSSPLKIAILYGNTGWPSNWVGHFTSETRWLHGSMIPGAS